MANSSLAAIRADVAQWRETLFDAPDMLDCFPHVLSGWWNDFLNIDGKPMPPVLLERGHPVEPGEAPAISLQEAVAICDSLLRWFDDAERTAAAHAAPGGPQPVPAASSMINAICSGLRTAREYMRQGREGTLTPGLHVELIDTVCRSLETSRAALLDPATWPEYFRGREVLAQFVEVATPGMVLYTPYFVEAKRRIPEFDWDAQIAKVEREGSKQASPGGPQGKRPTITVDEANAAAMKLAKKDSSREPGQNGLANCPGPVATSISKQEQAIKTILYALSIIKTECALHGLAGMLDLHRSIQRFFCRFLNEAYGLNLVELDNIQPNFPAIDLGDKGAQRCFQITSDNSSAKVQATLDTYVEKQLYETYGAITILVIGDRQRTYKKLRIPDAIQFGPEKNILGIRELIKHVKTLETPALERLVEVIGTELHIGDQGITTM